MLREDRLQIFLWLILAGIEFGFYGNILPTSMAYWATGLSMIVVMSVFYGHYFWIFPRYFDLKNTRPFFLIALMVVLLAALLRYWLDIQFILEFATRQPSVPNKHAFIFLRGFFWLWLVVLIGIVILMQNRIKEQILQTQQINEEKLGTELKLLKAQINPHFIFNALNNIYALAYVKSDTAPESILKLSKMLRYVLEECVNDRVTLKSEIDYIENFISFQRMKSPENQQIEFDYSETHAALKIAPMLFVPFIENSFKYSRIEADERAFVRIELSTEGNEIHFTIENSVPKNQMVKSGAGLGMENVKQRLNIIYPHDHQLTVREDNHVFSVNLGIKVL